MSLESQVKIRGAHSGDVPFVLNSWLKSFRDGNDSAASVPGPLYYPAQEQHARRLLELSVCFIAANQADPNQILAWAAVGRTGFSTGSLVLHYLYVKKPFRKLGAASLLLNHIGPELQYKSCHTRAMAHLDSRKLIFYPYLAGAMF